MNQNDLARRGIEMYSLAQKLWNFPRSLTGNGVRSTIAEISSAAGGLEVHEVDTGTKVGYW